MVANPGHKAINFWGDRLQRVATCELVIAAVKVPLHNAVTCIAHPRLALHLVQRKRASKRTWALGERARPPPRKGIFFGRFWWRRRQWGGEVEGGQNGRSINSMPGA